MRVKSSAKWQKISSVYKMATQFMDQDVEELQQPENNPPLSEKIENELDIQQYEFNVHHFAVVVSSVAWIIFIASFIGVGYFFPRYHPAQIFTSKKLKTNWSNAEKMKIFTHATDLHLAYTEPFKIVNTRLLLQQMIFYNPDFHLVSGDIADNYGKKNWPKIGRQIPGDWDLWEEILRIEAPNFTMLDIPGNHDMWGIFDPLSDQNLFLDHSHTYTRENTKNFDDFIIRKVKRDGLTFVLFNAYRFPNGHPPYFYWAHPTRDMLDLFEDMIESVGECYVIVHQPVDHFWWITSSKGHTFEEICQSKNIIALLSGHLHPVNPLFIHHKQGALEVVGPGAYQRKKFALVTIDNEQFVYHPISLAQPTNKFFLTYPVPIDQVTSHHAFNEEYTEIRLISYANKNVTIKVDGDFQGEMQYKETLPSGADLYTMPIHLTKEGIYNIKLTGDGCNISRTFCYGPTFKGKKEEAVLCQRGFLFLKIGSIPCFLCLLWIWFPFKLPFDSNNAEQWIDGSPKPAKWLQVIFASPNILRQRVKNLPKYIKNMMLFFVLYPLFMPNHIFKPIYGHFGYSFMCFVNIGGHLLYDEWAIHMSFFYLALFPTPATILFANTKFFKRSWAYWVSLAISIITCTGSQIINYRWIGEAVVVPLLFLNPTFVICPLIMYSVYFNYFRKHQNSFYDSLNI